MKNHVVSISGFLDLALVPLRSAARIRDLGLRRRPRETRIAVLREAAPGTTSQELIFQGDPQVGPQRAEPALARRERIVAEGLSLETIIALCERHHYRWRFHP